MQTGTPFISLWLDAEPNGDMALRLFSPTAERRIPFPTLGATVTAVEQFLPELAEIVPLTQSRWLLLLEPTLPETWQDLRWESLTLRGRPLGEQALIVRYAAWPAAGKSSAYNAEARLLNLFPDDEHDFIAGLQPHFRSGRLKKCRSSQLPVQLANSSELFIVAHGQATGLVDAGGQTFEIPDAYPMPACIWLLACNVNGAMSHLTRRLLEKGCHTVIAATGDLSAPQMEALIEQWCGASDMNPADWLAMHPNLAEGGVRALTVWGHIDLDFADTAEWNRRTWREAHGDHPAMPLDDETTREEFFAAYAQFSAKTIWPMTASQMAPHLLWLAERHDHIAIDTLKRHVGQQDTPAAQHALAVAARRAGNFEQMARYLSRGLGTPCLTDSDRSDYLGALANLFIDLDLPSAAQNAIEAHENCQLENSAATVWEEFKRLDWMARASARHGKLAVAFDHLNAKRRRAKPDDGRELAGLLYLSGWGQLTGEIPFDTSAALANEASHRLASVGNELIGYGNETSAYLLRALAAYAWASGDDAAISTVLRWQPVAVMRLVTDDPGPWAYTLIFLYLLKRISETEFERAIGALVRSRYYLEAGMFLGLAGHDDHGRDKLKRFQDRRWNTVVALNNKDTGNFYETARIEINARSGMESSVFGNAEKIVRSGVLSL
jgi:hypothetical protein